MLDNETKRRIDTARDILVGKLPDPKSQVEQITIALIYKFMDDMVRNRFRLAASRLFLSAIMRNTAGGNCLTRISAGLKRSRFTARR